MTALSETNRYRINGVLDTGKPVIENIENICNSCQSWFTYDNTTGKWGVIMNRAEISAFSFNDDNIVGAINVSTRGVESLYNSMEVNYPDRDLLDVNNTREHTIPTALQAANEPDSKLSLAYSLISDQTRAQNLAISELYSTRTDLTVTFATNFSMNAVATGDVVDITNNTYNWTAKLFRITNIREEDTGDGDIVYLLQASEYRDDIYNHITTRVTEEPGDGINTIANIGLLTNPVISKNEVAEKPFLQFETTIPGTGSPITGVEVWKYEITDPAELANWNDTAAYPDAARPYDLVFRKSPAEEDYYTPGIAFSAKTENIEAGNYLIKLRPVNDTTKGAFTDYLTTGVINFNPQITNAVVNEIDETRVQFSNIPAIYLAAEIGNVPTITASNVPVTSTILGSPMTNDSRGLLLTWDALFLHSTAGTAYDPATINDYQLTVTKKRSGQPDVLLTNEFGRTSQFGFAQGNFSTIAGVTFFIPNVRGNGTFAIGDVFEFGVTANSIGTNFSNTVHPTIRLEYYSI